MSDSADQPETLEGVLARVSFVSGDDRFGVGVLEVDGAPPRKVVGAIVGIDAGERVRMTGRTEINPRFGAQFRVESAYPVLPGSVEGVRAYLASRRVKGIGPRLADRIVAHFGDALPAIIAADPERLAEVPGVGDQKARSLVAALRGRHGRRDALIYMQGLGLGAGMANRVYAEFGDNAIAAIRANPYRLASEVSGVGFSTADRLARQLGFALDAPARHAAALVYALGNALDDGHVLLPRETLLEWAGRLIERPPASLGEELDTLLAEGRLIADGEAIYLRFMYAMEVEIAARLRALVERPPAPIGTDPAAWERAAGVELASTQREALALAAESALMVLTGGPGTGKTTIVRAVLAVYATLDGPVLLAAPTGRAARRLAEATGREAVTLHRLLEFSPREGCFRRDADHPLDAAALVVDEASMIDLPLFGALLRAIPPHARLLLVGDADQLPSVGPGNVLADLLASAAIPAARLVEVFRQSHQSLIVTSAHRIRAGLLPESAPAEANTGANTGANTPAPTATQTEPDFFVIEARDAAHAADLVEQLVAERIPLRFGLDAVADIQVLTPMHRGHCGAVALNERLQARLNPGAVIGRPSAGDKVMQLRNDYEREVFNGDVGRALTADAAGVTVAFDDRVVPYSTEARDALALAYACTVHKSQGSEYPAVVIPVVREHSVMLQRNLLYTAVTRGRRLVVLVVEPRALARAVDNTDGLRRFTGLAGRL